MSSVILAGDTSGTITLQAPAVAGTSVLTLPITTDTLIGLATTDTLTNKTLTAPILTTPALGTPSALVGTNITGTASGLTAGNVTTNANLTGMVTSVGNAATVVTNANLTGAITSVGNATSLGSFTSAQLSGALTDETGTGAAVFATSPTLVTPALGTPASGVVTNLTGTASININGTVGATTASTGSFTTLSATGLITSTPTSGEVMKFGSTTSGTGILYMNMFNTSGAMYLGIEGSAGGTLWTNIPAYATGLGGRNGGGGISFSANAQTQHMLLTTTGLAVTGTLSATGNVTGQGALGFIAQPSGGTALRVYGSSNATPTAHQWDIYLNSTNLRISDNTSGGSVVIDTAATIGSTLVVTAASNSLGVVINGRSSDNLGAMYFYANNGSTQHATITASASELQFSSIPAAAVQTFRTNGAERMRIDSSGKVGIGHTSPEAKLDISQPSSNSYATRTDWTTNAQLRLTDSYVSGASAVTKLVMNTSSGGYNNGAIIHVEGAGSYNAGQLVFSTGWDSGGLATERMRLDSSGNLLLNQTSGNADAKFSVNAGSTDASPCIDFRKGSATTTTAQVFTRFFTSAGAVATGSITANGVSSATFTAYSDKRLKENIVDLPSQLSNIMALRPVEFDFKGYENGEGHQLGFIAQEVQEIYPDLVGEGADGMLTLSDMNKNDARLIKCIQEQQALILALTDRITALENN